ncbi:MAG: hypothetical protein FK734_16940 [Asgard group archaeon]|nr:hypothetical protein [Asgard group archaeon]
MKKDKIFGYLIAAISVIVLIGWMTFTSWGIAVWNASDPFINNRLTIVLLAVPVMLGMFIVFAIATWIGWTMARTPPPTPIDLEDFESLEEETEKTNKDEKKK